MAGWTKRSPYYGLDRSEIVSGSRKGPCRAFSPCRILGSARADARTHHVPLHAIHLDFDGLSSAASVALVLHQGFAAFGRNLWLIDTTVHERRDNNSRTNEIFNNHESGTLCSPADSPARVMKMDAGLQTTPLLQTGRYDAAQLS